MIQIRKAQDRGHFNYGWLDTYHTFSFADYHDPRHTQFRDLRVINEDRVEPGAGFPTHSHRDMEILTYIVQGALEHKDSMGNTSIIRPGEVQRMSAGTGVTHSEFNPSKKEPVHLLQIWILPEKKKLAPSYEQKKFSDSEKRDRFLLVASQNGADGSVTLHQNAKVYSALIAKNNALTCPLSANRYGWIQLIQGRIKLDGHTLETSDGAALSKEENPSLKTEEASEILFFDLK